MKLQQTLTLKQSLKMTVKMQESIKLLQLSNQDILKYINDAVKNNPFLELEKNKKKGDKIEFSYNENVFLRNQKKQFHSSFSTISNLFENKLEQKKNLKDHLTEQLNIDINSIDERSIGTMFINCLDNNGYINEIDVNNIFYYFNDKKKGYSRKKIDQVLKKLQKFDPPGIFARNLSECLQIQLKEKEITNNYFDFLLNNLELIAKNKIDFICKKLTLKKNAVLDMIRIIKNLNPKPGSIYDIAENNSIIPDITLKVNHGIFRVNINKSFVPKINFNKDYYNKIKEKNFLIREKENLKEWAENGKWLIDALKNRSNTLEKVTKEIIQYQKKFFLGGIENLNPLTLKEIAKKTNLHESTISRATTNKYIESPRGVHELKFFFSKGIECGPDSIMISNKKIKAQIVELIKKENKNNIMSDENIVIKLKSNGISIARRTVAKYRKMMNIPSAFGRKNINS